MDFESNEDRDRLYDYHKHNLVYISDYIKFADGKAGIALGATLVMLGFFGRQVKKNGFTDLTFAEYSLILGLLLLVGAIYVFMLKVLWPKYPSDTTAYMSWGGIGAFPNSSEYTNRINSLSNEQFINSLADQNYSIARVCLGKYQNLKYGFILMTVGAVIECVSWIFG